MSDEETADAPDEEEAGDASEEQAETETAEAAETEADAEATGADEEAELEEPVSEETVEEQLDDAEADLEAAETETDLDAVEAKLDKIEGLLESADLPEPDDEDEEGVREEFESRLSDLRDELEEARGPYAEDVIETVESAGTTVEETRWTERGREQLRETVETFVAEVEEVLDTDLATTVTTETEDLSGALEDAAVAVGEADLDPDEDDETLAALVAAAEELAAGVEDAEEWDDLEVREQLQAEGYFDVLDHRKDFPPEWHALKIWEKRDRADMVLLALDKLDSNFMEEHCLDSLARMGNPETLDAMTERAQRRDHDAIKIIGKIGHEDGLEAILDYVDSDPGLAKPALKAVGEIGSNETTQAVANRLAADDAEVRSQAARALGLIGDTRAIEPLADTLETDDADEVRASAAWALNQIGTDRALEAVRPYTDDRAFLVQNEAEKALDDAGRAA